MALPTLWQRQYLGPSRPGNFRHREGVLCQVGDLKNLCKQAKTKVS